MISIRARCLACGTVLEAVPVGWMNVTPEFLNLLEERGDPPESAQRGDLVRVQLGLRHLRHSDIKPFRRDREDLARIRAERCPGRLGLAAAHEAKQRSLPLYGHDGQG